MRITARDIVLLRWINGFGFVFTRQIARWRKVSYSTAYERMAMLRSAGYLKTDVRFVHVPHLVSVTGAGCALAGETLPPVKTPGLLGSFNHDVELVHLALTLEETHSGSIFVPERRLRLDRGFRSDGHLPDGELLLQGRSRPIAIELELSQKSAARLRTIINRYRCSFRYEAVWYFTSPAETARIREATRDDPLFVVSEIEYVPCL